jgi:DNA-directed RNA polymerase subunit M/transcription elongation factor TFIIS
MDAGALKCRLCGYTEPLANPNVASTEPTPVAPRRKLKPSYAITHRGEIDKWAQAAFDTGQDCIRQEKWDEAIRAFQRALDNQPDFIDAHLWIARISEDPAVQRDHLTTLLAYDPNHIEAIRELMVLDGKLTPEEAERAERGDDPQRREVGAPVGMDTTVLRCPVCGGDLTVDDANGRVLCKFCGYSEKRALSKQVREESLTMAMLERKAQPVQWVIGERLLHCNNCGAERTIPATKLSARCPFCGSNHVIERDALGSFQQPDGLVPFAISRQAAEAAIKEKLSGWTERIKGWFDNNKVSRATLEGCYLPFWVFDAIVDVTRTVIDKRPPTRQGRVENINPYTRDIIPEMVNNLPICAVTSPPPDVTSKLGRFDMEAMVVYQPDLLAKYPAGLYNLDFDKASLEARDRVGKLLREKYAQRSSDEVQVNIFSGVKHMSFQLALLPVWVGTLVEEDGDVRLALVNGQTGAVALGRSEKRGK